MYIKKLITLACVFLLLGCQSTLMEPVAGNTITNVKKDESRVVFMRSAFLANAIQASVFDVTNGTPKFIGIISNDTKVTYDTAPGEYTFMVVGESADFLKATITEDKTYYSIVTPRMGFWKARFSLHPVKNTESAKFKYNSKKFEKMQADTKYVKTSPKALAWANKNTPDITEKLAEYLPEWEAKSKEKQEQATINAEDSIN